MEEKLNNLKIGSFLNAKINQDDVDDFVGNAIIVLPAGGESARFKPVSGDDVQKSAFVLPNGETMIERTISMYRDFGFKKFLVLLYHNGSSIEDLLKGDKYVDVSISYSYDPNRPVGRGGAVLNAYLKKMISDDNHFIVHNPDDQLMGNQKELLRKIIAYHISHERKGAKATAVVSLGAEYPYSALSVEDGVVTESATYPVIPIPTHTGMTVFSPSVLGDFKKLFNLENKTDFEPVLFPFLIKRKELFACPVGVDEWIAVNDEKGLKKLSRAL